MDEAILFELYQSLPRQGPGNDAATLTALSWITNLPSKPRILDVGCGSGMQTIALAKALDCHIIAVDIHQPFLDQLTQRSQEAGVSESITLVNASMDALTFPESSFDLIWSEGAIYLMGFEAGLTAWRSWLTSRGYLVVSELSWLQPNPPKPIQEFWQQNYPAMQSIAENLQVIEHLGYQTIQHFSLPSSGWWEHYYSPLESRIHTLRQQYAADSEVLSLLKDSQREIDLYRQYSDWYGYVFYVMQPLPDSDQRGQY